MPDTRAASRLQKRKREVLASGDWKQSSVDPGTIQSPPAFAGDRHTKKKRKPDRNARASDAPPATRSPRPIHAPSERFEATPNTDQASRPTVNIAGARDEARADMADVIAQVEQEDWHQLIDRILQELRETFTTAGSNLPSATETFLCDLLSAILLRSYRAYSLEKLFGQGNSGPRGAVKDAIEQDDLEMSFEAVDTFATRNGERHIENVKGNRASKDLTTGVQFFKCIWGDHPIISRKHWDTADFRQQYRRICKELDIPGPAHSLRAKFKVALEYRFFQSQTIFCYPDINNGIFASTGKGSNVKGSYRKVWYHQTPLLSEKLPSEDILAGAVKSVVRCNENPTEYYWEKLKPRRLPEHVQSWELMENYCRTHRLPFARQWVA